MPCYYPITALQPTAGGPLLFPKDEHLYLYNDYRTLQIGCGRCRGCRMKRTRQWAIRCVHEKQMHKHNCFLTLTYNDANLPTNGTLVYKHFQRFMRNLRRQASAPVNATFHRDPKGAPLRGEMGPAHRVELAFYMAGEYTEPEPEKGYPGGRPHYHALIFGIDFADKIYLQRTGSGEKIYRSPTLEKLWKKGFSSLGELTYKSAAYVARYVMKKRTGDGEKQDYKIIDPDTGEIYEKKKEFNNMSRRPGVGSTWLKKYTGDVYNTGKVITNGYPQNPPRYYDKQYKKIDQAALEEFQWARQIEAMAMREHQTPERLAVQEQVAAARERSLKRHLT